MPRAALLLLSVFHFTNLFFYPSSYDFGQLDPSTMSAGQKALQRLKELNPVQQRRAAAILGTLLADVASKSITQLLA